MNAKRGGRDNNASVVLSVDKGVLIAVSAPYRAAGSQIGM